LKRKPSQWRPDAGHLCVPGSSIRHVAARRALRTALLNGGQCNASSGDASCTRLPLHRWAAPRIASCFDAATFSANVREGAVRLPMFSRN
jgi:hypothetical protein